MQANSLQYDANCLKKDGDPYGIRTRVAAVKGRCTNHYTNGSQKRSEDQETPKEKQKRVSLQTVSAYKHLVFFKRKTNG